MRILIVLAMALMLSACDAFDMLGHPTGPTRVDVSTLTSWYPCVIVQPAGNRGSPEFENQFTAVRKLQRAGKMNWIRLGNNKNTDYQIESRRLGLKIFSIVDIDELEESSSWEDAFDNLHALYQGDIWEIGGEISNPFINRHLLTPEQYMSKFKNLYNHVRSRYPGVVLTSAATFGSSSTFKNNFGPAELQRFIELGLLDMDVIIAVNVYTEDALQQYASVFSRYSSRLAGKRIWVTETGSSDPNRHIEWVNRFYPEIIATLHPEMVCWYVMWAGDNDPDNSSGLLNNVSTPNPEERNLFKALTEGLQ